MKEKSIQRRLASGLVALWLLLLARGAAWAQTVEEFYKGRDVSLYVGSTAGGGFDLFGRLIARHMGRYIPGHPNVVVKNMPGAGGMALINYMNDVAAKDGTSIAIINPTMTTAPFITPNIAKWDAREFVWLGSANAEISTCAFWPLSGVQGVEDLSGRNKELVIGALGPATGSTIDAITLRSLMGWKWKIVQGYPGLANAIKAAESGEVDGVCGIAVTTLKARLWESLRRRELKVMIQTSLRSHPELPGVIRAFDLPMNAESAQIMGLVFGPWIFGRPFITTPQSSPERVEALRSAFKQVLSDPELLADAEKLNSEVSFMPPEDIRHLVEGFYQTSPGVRERTRQIIEGGQ